MMESESIG